MKKWPFILHDKGAQNSPSEPVKNDDNPSSHTEGKPFYRKRYVQILAALVIVFLATSMWNLGDRHAPTSDYTPQSDPEDIYLDLGNTTRVDRVYLLIQDTSGADVDIYWGTWDNWTLARNLKESGGCRKWDYVDVGQDTRYIRLEFKGSSGRIGEVALLQGDSKLAISGISTTGNTTTAQALIDEQQYIGNPGSSVSTTYFDEIYYVCWSAEKYLNIHEITDWQSQTNWDHPPLSRIIIAANIAIFGHNPFAWRIGGVFFAALAIIFVFLLAKRMFGTPRAGLIAAFLLTFDCLHFAQARIATPDTYLFCFFAGMVYFFYRYWEDPARGGKYLFWSLVFFGLGFSTKWFIMYGFAGLMILLVILKIRERKIRWSEVLWLIGGGLAAVSIYMLCYLPYFIAPLEHGSLRDWWNVQWAMFEFHSTLRATHAASSPWYSWPVMANPVWFYVGYFPTTRAYIASFGNPALWWATIPAMISTVPVFFAWIVKSARIDIKAITDSIARRSGLSQRDNDSGHASSVMSRKLGGIAIKIINMTAIALSALWHEMGSRRWAMLFIIIPFLSQWLLFMPIGRVVFLYHFYPSLLFVILAVTLWANWLWKRFKWGKWVVGCYLVLNVFCFIFLFPAMSGLIRSNAYWDSMKWLVNWII